MGTRIAEISTLKFFDSFDGSQKLGRANNRSRHLKEKENGRRANVGGKNDSKEKKCRKKL